MTQLSHSYTLQIADCGLLPLPQAVCTQLNLRSGDRLILTLEADGSLRLVPLSQQLQTLRGIFKNVAPGVSLADELIQDRRKEAQEEWTAEVRSLAGAWADFPNDFPTAEELRAGFGMEG